MARGPGVIKTNRLDAGKAEEQFKADMAKMAQPTPESVTTMPFRQRLRGRIHVRGFLHQEYEFDLEQTQSIADALDPTFYKDHVRAIMGEDPLKPKGRGSLIHVFKPDTGQYAKLLITEIGPGYVRTIPVEQASPEQIDLPAGAPFVTRWNSGKRGHEVLRKADNALMAGPFQTMSAAAAWVVQHMTAMGGPEAA